MKYNAPALTPFGRVSEITGITGTAINQDFLTINGGNVQEGNFGTGDPGQINCDYKLSGGNYTYIGDQSLEQRCEAILEDWLALQ